MICLKTLIGHGASRDCYVHPQDGQKCVKVAKTPKALRDIRREIMINKLLQPVIGDCIPSCGAELADTDKGPGMVCELIRDCDGTISRPIRDVYGNSSADTGYDARLLEPSLNYFIEKIIKNDIFFFDFNLGNFVFQISAPGKMRFVYVDAKSLNENGYCGFLKLDRFVAPLARIIMFRRIRRLYRTLGYEFPFDGLCSEKMFSTFWVTWRVRSER